LKGSSLINDLTPENRDDSYVPKYDSIINPKYITTIIKSYVQFNIKTQKLFLKKNNNQNT